MFFEFLSKERSKSNHSLSMENVLISKFEKHSCYAEYFSEKIFFIIFTLQASDISPLLIILKLYMSQFFSFLEFRTQRR